MDIFTIFWEHIALDIEQSYQNGHPANWKKAKIETFLFHLEERLSRICKASATKAELLGLRKNQNNSYQYDELKIPSYSTFLRIFKEKTSNGKVSTRHKFAIYLGYECFEDYVNQNKIKGPLNGSEQNIELIHSSIREQIASVNRKYEMEYKKRMGQAFYLCDVPFSINNNQTIYVNPLQYLSKNKLNKGDNWELVELLQDLNQESALETINEDWSFIISGFGFGKTSLLLNIFKMLQHKEISAIFVPIAQLPEKSFQNTDFFCRAILNILYNKVYSKSAQVQYFGEEFIDFEQQEETIVEPMVKDFKEMLMSKNDIVFLFDGLDENYLAYTHKGLKQIFTCIQTFQLPCFFSVREEFWYDKQGNFQLALGEDTIRKIFLKEWNDQAIVLFVEQYLHAFSHAPFVKKHLSKFITLIKKGAYQKYYGDIPKRPLFLNMLTQDVIKGNLQKRNLAQLYENYLQVKFRLDLERAFEENTELQSIKLLSEEDATKVLRKIFAVLTQVSSIMMINSETHEAILISDTTEEKIEQMVRLLKEKTFSITEILLNSVLIPIHKRETFNDFRVKFAHKSFQEYFTARYLFELLKNSNATQPDCSIFQYKFDISITRFLMGILENEKQNDYASFEHCMHLLNSFQQNHSLVEGALGNILCEKFCI